MTYVEMTVRRDDGTSKTTDVFIYYCNLCLSLVRSPFYTIPQIQDSSGILRSVVLTVSNLADFDLGDLGLLEALTLGKLLSCLLTYD